jgi:hypothetical protein
VFWKRPAFSNRAKTLLQAGAVVSPLSPFFLSAERLPGRKSKLADFLKIQVEKIRPYW